jgi:hypothetical protein
VTIAEERYNANRQPYGPVSIRRNQSRKVDTVFLSIVFYDAVRDNDIKITCHEGSKSRTSKFTIIETDLYIYVILF